jgi:hypothetical protein
MKKILLMLCLTLIIVARLNAQQYDDGFVTRNLPVNVSSEKFQTFVKGFKAGIDNVAGGMIRSNDDIIQTYGIDPLRYPRLNDVVANSDPGAYNYRYSENFLRAVQNVFAKTGNEYDNVYSIRNALKNVTSVGSLNTNEAEALAAIDISVQEVAKRFITSFTGASIAIPGQPFQFAGFVDQNRKLPGWARCVLGVIGEAIMGGFSGVKLGTMVGGALGGVVGGIIGVGGGMFSGAARYC